MNNQIHLPQLNRNELPRVLSHIAVVIGMLTPTGAQNRHHQIKQCQDR
jgi:hypothetical protein